MVRSAEPVTLWSPRSRRTRREDAPASSGRTLSGRHRIVAETRGRSSWAGLTGLRPSLPECCSGGVFTTTATAVGFAMRGVCSPAYGLASLRFGWGCFEGGLVVRIGLRPCRAARRDACRRQRVIDLQAPGGPLLRRLAGRITGHLAGELGTTLVPRRWAGGLGPFWRNRGFAGLS